MLHLGKSCQVPKLSDKKRADPNESSRRNLLVQLLQKLGVPLDPMFITHVLHNRYSLLNYSVIALPSRVRYTRR